MFTVGALRQADPAALRLAHIAWRDELAPLTKPLLIVNVGGPTSISYIVLAHFILCFNLWPSDLGCLFIMLR